MDPIVLLGLNAPSRGLADLLAVHGFRMISAREAPTLTHHLESSEWNVLVLDARLFPDGIEEIAALLKDHDVRQRPAILLADQEDIDSLDIVMSMELDVMTKPVHGRLLIDRIRRTLETKRNAEERRRNDDRLARARRMARFASWEWRIETGEFLCDPELLEIFGARRYRGATQIVKLIERVHPADRSFVEAAWASRRTHRLEYRL